MAEEKKYDLEDRLIDIRKNYSKQVPGEPVLAECKELICILGKSISTAERNNSNKLGC